MTDEIYVPPRAYGGCQCPCHTHDSPILHMFPCCAPKPGYEDLNPKLQDSIDYMVQQLKKSC